MMIAAIILAHPDDAELRCFGTICKYVSEGIQCSLVIASSGEHGVSISDEELIDITGFNKEREKETLKAFEGMDIEITFLHQRDGYMLYGRDLIYLIESTLRKIKPDIVITHYPDAYGSDHQDHSAVGMSVLNSINRIDSVRTVLLCDPLKTVKSHFTPNYFIDITEYFDKKMHAIKCQESQKGRFYLEEQFHRNKGEFYAANISYDFARDHRVFEAYELYWQWN